MVSTACRKAGVGLPATAGAPSAAERPRRGPGLRLGTGLLATIMYIGEIRISVTATPDGVLLTSEKAWSG